MNEWLKQFFERVRKLWTQGSVVQRGIFIGIVVVVLAAIIIGILVSASPSQVAVIGTPITDEGDQAKIANRFDEEGIDYTIRDGRFYVADQLTRRRAQNIIFQEDLIPAGTNPWDVFNVDQFSVTDFERKVQLQEAVRRQLEMHIESIEGIDDANVTITLPETTVFAEQQQPTTASIILTPTPGSGATTNRKILEGIQRLVALSVEGLNPDNIVITDRQGVIVNDFEDLADFDALKVAEKQMRLKRQYEAQYIAQIFNEMGKIFGRDRVTVVNADVRMDFSKETSQSTEYSPIIVTPDNPETPYSERETQDNILLSRETNSRDFKGTGFNPEGPAGQEGQIPPAYQDLENLVGTYSDSSSTENYQVNETHTQAEKPSWQPTRISIAVAIDGKWRTLYDDHGRLQIDEYGSIKREYIPPTDAEMKAAQDLIMKAVGYDPQRGDSVSVVHLQKDRSDQFASEDDAFRAQQRLRDTIIYSIISLGIIIVALVIFRLISRELERRRRLREEELARQHQAMREAALRSAEEEGVEVQMSVEERARMEMQESAINMAREHPEDVAQLIRTWLIEE